MELSQILKLFDLSQSLHQSLRVKKVIYHGLVALNEFFEQAQAFLYLTTPNSDLKTFTLDEHCRLLQKASQNPPAAMAQWVITTGEHAILNARAASWEPKADQRLNHYMTLPLLVEGRPIGAVQLSHPAGAPAFTAEALSLLEKLGSMLASALANAKAFERQETFNRELEKEIKSTTDQLRKANDELREAELARSESISMVAHELRTPITSIAGFAALFMKGKLGPLTNDQMEFCTIIKKNSSYIERMINDLLVLTKLELDKLELKFEPVSCANLIMEALAAIKGSEPEHLHRVHLDHIQKGLMVKGDRLRLLQVLANMISNALKYAPDQTPVYVGCFSENGKVIFSIDDLGTPLTDDQRSKVFEKFYRIKSSAKKTGSGLGLAICQNIMAKHHGRVWTTANRHGGNSFLFSLDQLDVKALTYQAPSYSEEHHIEDCCQTAT